MDSTSRASDRPTPSAHAQGRASGAGRTTGQRTGQATGGTGAAIDALRTTYTPEAIERMVETFYAEVRLDPLLGPIFERRVADWPTHLERMRAFWRSVLRAEPAYQPERGSPRQIHAAMAEVTRDHYARWLALFERTASEIFEPAAAAGVVFRAERIAAAFSRELP